MKSNLFLKTCLYQIKFERPVSEIIFTTEVKYPKVNLIKIAFIAARIYKPNAREIKIKEAHYITISPVFPQFMGYEKTNPPNNHFRLKYASSKFSKKSWLNISDKEFLLKINRLK
jgi:hypothetical protein